MFSRTRNKTAGSTSSTLQSNNGSLGQLLQRNSQPRSGEQLDNNSVSSKRSLLRIPKGLKRNKTNNTTTTQSPEDPNNTTQSKKGFILKNAMQQEISRHRGARERNVSPDITEEGSSSGSDESSEEAYSSPSHAAAEALLQSKNDWEMFGGCGTLTIASSKEDKTAPDTLVQTSSSETSSSSDSDDSSQEETKGGGGYGCGAIEDVTDSENGSEDQLSVASPIGTPGICGISDWLCATDYDLLQSDQNKRVDYRDEAAELNKHQGQIDIYGNGELPNSLKLRRYSKSPRPQMNDHILVKVKVRWKWCFAGAIYFAVFSIAPLTHFFSLQRRLRFQSKIASIDPPDT